MVVPNGTTVTCTVVANNINGPSTASAASNSVTPSTVPDAPTIGTAVANDGSVDVAFTANGDGGNAITGYTATCGPGAFTGTGTVSPINESSPERHCGDLHRGGDEPPWRFVAFGGVERGDAFDGA